MRGTRYCVCAACLLVPLFVPLVACGSAVPLPALRVSCPVAGAPRSIIQESASAGSVMIRAPPQLLDPNVRSGHFATMSAFAANPTTASFANFRRPFDPRANQGLRLNARRRLTFVLESTVPPAVVQRKLPAGGESRFSQQEPMRRPQMTPNFFNYVPGYRRLSNVLRKHYDPHGYGSNPFLRAWPAGHYYSPLPDPKFVDERKATLFNRQVESIPGIENNEDGQLALAETLSQYYRDLPFTDKERAGLRYYFDNIWFSYGDAIILNAMLRHYKPRRIVEVGSGFSSAVMLDTNDLHLSKQISCTFIEPEPERLFTLLSEEDKKRHEVIVGMVQDVPLTQFELLDANDILFIDSSHVVKIGSDVVHLLTNVLPILREGVIVHFHDVFWPFEYPERWVQEGKAWNENYLIKAFLQFNSKFRILFFNSYLATHHEREMGQKFPLWLRDTGGSLWLQRTS